MMEDDAVTAVPWCRKCRRATYSALGGCGHMVCGLCGRRPPCDGPIKE